jgi:hypothetical protein
MNKVFAAGDLKHSATQEASEGEFTYRFCRVLGEPVSAAHHLEQIMGTLMLTPCLPGVS